ncbi:hypothetical protein GXP67_06440 [Rhodocytophaga rosea]|uniref:Uncharacterized protein n=1 Tax=Rhodocytophaga rosea TaxID=2704465 RepID=A0A6C0GEB2_9BACT|nr:hypothetical protein [Rhodocytophaga rosea]QHT66321.1 hypothetical protein GXP67_06440 [Rhodocytophaga rosea]
MQAVLYIEITESLDFSYEKPLLAYIQQCFPQVIQFDIDNHSDAMLVSYAIKLLEEANQVLLIVEAREGKTQTLLPFFEKLLVYQYKTLVVYNGNNAAADRYIHLVADERKRKDIPMEEAKTIIQAFFQSMP